MQWLINSLYDQVTSQAYFPSKILLYEDLIWTFFPTENPWNEQQGCCMLIIGVLQRWRIQVAEPG